MAQAYFRFYAELNDFLPPGRRMVAFPHASLTSASVKDMIEALGVPHTEVDLILANGVSVDFSYLVQDGDRISVYPVFESIDITPVVRVRPEPLRHLRFVLDGHLGGLAAYLRLLGFDSLYRNDYADEELARVASAEGRILLTRDRGLLKRSEVTRGYCVRATQPKAQLLEVVARFDLRANLAPFSRCLLCNGLLEPVAKEDVADRLLPRTRQHYHVFWKCDLCGQIYWPGPHYRRLAALVAEVHSPAEDATAAGGAALNASDGEGAT